MRLFAGLALFALSQSGCAASGAADARLARANLAGVGLEWLDEVEAGVPEAERGRYVPCRVRPGFRQPALPPHPAGYLIVGVGRARTGDARVIWRALAEWRRGEALKLAVRRNPYRSTEPDWWEAEVELRLP